MTQDRKSIIIVLLIIFVVFLIIYLLLRTGGGDGNFNSQINERQKALETDVITNQPIKP